MNENKVIYQLLTEIAVEKNINIRTLSHGWIIELNKNGINRYVLGNVFDLNNFVAAQIASDKYAAYELIEKSNIPIIKCHLVFNPATMCEYMSDEGIMSSISKYLDKYGTIVIKPNVGSGGKGVYKCETQKEAEAAIFKLFQTKRSLSICPYYNIVKEYRTFYLDGECLLTYGKSKPKVIGDGISTIRELMNKKVESTDRLLNEKIDFDDIPAKNETVELFWKHNLSQGASIDDIHDKTKLCQIHDLAKKAGMATAITFATVDIAELESGELLVMEVNSGIGMSRYVELSPNGFINIKGVLSTAVDKMFCV